MRGLPAFVAAIEVHLKPGALDPQGQAVGRGLRSLGHTGVTDVRVGKHLRVRLEASDLDAARTEVERMCRELLANPVMETFVLHVTDDPRAQP